MQGLLNQRMKYFINEENARWDEKLFLVDYYDGNHLEYVKKRTGKDDLSSDIFPYQTIPLTKWIINKISQVYKKPPTRTGKGGKELNEKYLNLIKTKNNWMKELERQDHLMPVVACRPVIQNDSDGEYFHYQLIRYFKGKVDPNNTSKFLAIWYPIASNNINQ